MILLGIILGWIFVLSGGGLLILNRIRLNRIVKRVNLLIETDPIKRKKYQILKSRYFGPFRIFEFYPEQGEFDEFYTDKVKKEILVFKRLAISLFVLLLMSILGTCIIEFVM
jgi:hypothetical protein